MRVAHIAFKYGLCNTGGAAIASTRLHQALLAQGVESHYICIHQSEPGVNVHELPRGWSRKLFLALTKVSRCFWHFTPYRKSICLNIVPMFGLEKLLARLSPDVVHVQWLNADVCSFKQLSRLPYRVVFNLHDLFVVNAIDSYPCRDRRFKVGFFGENSSMLERWCWRRKNEMIRKLRPKFVGPSEWVCDECRQSLIGKGFSAYAVPNLMSDEFYCPIRVNSKNNTRFNILFGAYGGRWNPLKGFEDLVKALQDLPAAMKDKCSLMIFGEVADRCEISGVETVFLGKLESPKSMIDVYSSADVFAFPSREETQGMTKVEAMLCGLPVVAFNRSACAEGIEHGLTGWVARGDDVKLFSEGLLYYFKLWESDELGSLRKTIGQHARNRFEKTWILNLLRRDVYEESGNADVL